MPEPLSTRVLPGRVDPEALFVALESESSDLFWLDAGAGTGAGAGAGAGAAEGWSFLGTGVRSAFPSQVRLDGEATTDDLPPLLDGWVGWADYESGARVAGAPAAETPEAAGGAWLRVTSLVAVEHRTGRAWASAPAASLDEWASFAAEASRRAADAPLPPTVDRTLPVQPRHTPDEYAALIERCRELIRAGVAYQLCLTTRFTVDGRHDAATVYRRLRAATPAHHGGFIRIGGRALLSASPEQFLHVRDGVIRTRPIKGTRPRSDDPVHDVALAAELAADPKERAENVMIVDLMRNDLSRVCEPGSIRVEALWSVESYPAVHQLVSTVSGVPAAGTTVGALFEAAFPAGSMTGAPKLSAMTRLHELERAPRGIYAGCFGYIGRDGAVDLAMVIRSIVVDGEGASVGAGGGITWGSVAASEVAEVATKARAPLAALGAEMPAAWASDILN